ncbi:unnamed protein product [Amaranthus hypochondriacus]
MVRVRESRVRRSGESGPANVRHMHNVAPAIHGNHPHPHPQPSFEFLPNGNLSYTVPNSYHCHPQPTTATFNPHPFAFHRNFIPNYHNPPVPFVSWQGCYDDYPPLCNPQTFPPLARHQAQPLAVNGQNKSMDNTPTQFDRTNHRPSPGHRGYTSLPWRPGPREPARPVSSPKPLVMTTLFIDHLPRGISPDWLHDLFSEYGAVEDVFVSKKIRKSCRDAFGFVKFKKSKDAQTAIIKLNGHVIKNSKIKVTVARYGRDGKEVQKKGSGVNQVEVPSKQRRGIEYPSHRDGRKYAEVVTSARKPPQPATVTPVQYSLKVTGDPIMADKLTRAAVVEYEDETSPKQAAAMVVDSNVPFAYISAISPLKLILFFETEKEVCEAIEDTSPLWDSFVDVRRWTKEECLKERLVWIECRGIHPIWWNYENLKMIGEKWGHVVKVDDVANGVHSLSLARILIKTKSQARIDACLNVEWEDGSCKVWAKEVCCCECMDKSDTSQKEKKGGSMEMEVENQIVSQSVVNEEDDPITSIEKVTDQCNEELSVEEWWGGPMSCPVDQRLDAWFDPMATVECSLSMADGGSKGANGQYVNGGMETNAKKPRGRPKRFASSLPDTLSVPSTPSICSSEAIETWQTAKMLGVSAPDERAVIEELRKSKRIQVLEAKNTSMAR